MKRQYSGFPSPAEGSFKLAPELIYESSSYRSHLLQTAYSHTTLDVEPALNRCESPSTTRVSYDIPDEPAPSFLTTSKTRSWIVDKYSEAHVAVSEADSASWLTYGTRLHTGLLAKCDIVLSKDFSQSYQQSLELVYIVPRFRPYLIAYEDEQHGQQ